MNYPGSPLKRRSTRGFLPHPGPFDPLFILLIPFFTGSFVLFDLTKQV
jgi:hypothetical protein